MLWLFLVLAAVCTFVIAAVTIGWVTRHQALRPRRAVYDVDEAVSFVADRLPDEVTAQVSYPEVRQVLMWHLDYLHAKGVASGRTDEDIAERLVVVTDDEPVAYILGRADAAAGDGADTSLTDEHVVLILDANLAYYREIGAIGAEVGGPPEP